MTPKTLSFTESEKKYEAEIQAYVKGIIQNDSQALIVYCDVVRCLKLKYHELETEEDVKSFLYEAAGTKSMNHLKYQLFIKNSAPMFKIVSIGRWGDIGGILLFFAGLIDFLFYSHTLDALMYSYGLYLAVKLLVSYITYREQKRAFRNSHKQAR
jgi:hypothetical protein